MPFQEAQECAEIIKTGLDFAEEIADTCSIISKKWVVAIFIPKRFSKWFEHDKRESENQKSIFVDIVISHKFITMICKDQPFFMTEISPLNNLEGNFTIYQNANFFSTKVANSLIYCIHGSNKVYERVLCSIFDLRKIQLFFAYLRNFCLQCANYKKIAVKKPK